MTSARYLVTYSRKMKIALAQLNPTVGDLKGNLELLRRTLEAVEPEKPDLVIFPAMFLTGCPLRDLINQSWFGAEIEKALNEIREISYRFPAGIILGAVTPSQLFTGRGFHNTALLFSGGQEQFRQAKSLFPYHDMSDEERYFDPAPSIQVTTYRETVLGISIGEDAYNPTNISNSTRRQLWGRKIYQFDPLAQQARAGANLFLNIASSPFWIGKRKIHTELVRTHISNHRRPFIFVNLVGANDELVFDGGSFVFNENGNPITVLPEFEEKIAVVDLKTILTHSAYEPLPEIDALYQALTLGVRDYVHKCGFKNVIIGLSGGIDSAVVCCIAVSALGNENVLGVTMPSPFSSPESVADSRRLAENLGIQFSLIPISPIYHSYLEALHHSFASRKPDVTEENIQARVRGNILMALSNKLGYLVLNTGNKSELAVGYCTLYGDMSGALAVLGDVPKTTVYQLARHINREKEIIPTAIIEKPPSAELRPNQKDQDTLPPYEILDPIISRYFDEGLSPEEIVQQGFASETVMWVIENINRNEYKRRQAPPVIKVTTRLAGRRLPIAARYRY
ncbi:MAG: NAD+ synthase [bacterium]